MKNIKLIFLLLLSILLFSCKKPVDPTITKIEVVEETVLDSYTVESLDLDSIEFIVYFSDETTNKITLSDFQLSEEDLSKFSIEGTHTFNLVYEGYSITLTLTFTSLVLKYTITFLSFNNTLLTYQLDSGEYIDEPNQPQSLGYTFEGWYLEDSNTPFEFGLTPVSSNIDLYASWSIDENTYASYIGNVPNMNPHFITLANAVTLYSLISDTLYYGDFDWDEMIVKGVIEPEDIGDLTKVTFGRIYKDASELPFNYFPSMATAIPFDVNGNGKTWRITLRNDLKFVDGTIINAHTFSESYRLLLDPKLLNKNARYLFNYDSIPLKNAEGYYNQGTPYDYSDPNSEFWPSMNWSEVGFNIIDDYTFELELNMPKSQWHMMSYLANAISSVIHVENYVDGFQEFATSTTYGKKENPLVSFGAYKLIKWVENSYYVLERNDDHHRASEFRIQFIRYNIINDQSVATKEFNNGHLDQANVSETYFADYEDNPNLKISPITTFYRLAFSLNREDGNPIIQDVDFRKAMYLAVDRTTFSETVRKPSIPTHGILGPVYYSSLENVFTYRNSKAGKKVLEDFAPDSNGYDPIEAKRLFDLAYNKAVSEGKIEAGSKIVIEFLINDTKSYHDMADWLSDKFASIFGSDKFELKKKIIPWGDITGEAAILEIGDFDIAFGGWQSMQFEAPSLLQVYSSVKGIGYILERGFDTGNAIVNVDLTNGKEAVQMWLNDLLDIPLINRSEIEKDYIDSFTWFLTKFGIGDDDGVWTGTYDELWDNVYYGVFRFGSYDNKDVEMDNITASLEGELFRQMINIPLFVNTEATIYSDRIGFDVNAPHARLGWGGFKYMYFED